MKPACVDVAIFNPSKRKNPKLVTELNLANKIVCVYAGKFGGIYLTNEVFAFFHEAEKFWGDKFTVLLLTSQKKEELLEWSKAGKFNPEKMIVRFVPHEHVAEYMGLGDFAITPVKPIPTKKYCTPIKDGEYWGLGLPVVITKNISDDSDIINKYAAGAIINDFSSEDYKKAIEKIDHLLKEDSATLSARIENIAKQFRSFKIAEDVYESLYGEKQ